jgi:hypothetical protein
MLHTEVCQLIKGKVLFWFQEIPEIVEFFWTEVIYLHNENILSGCYTLLPSQILALN